MKNPMKRSYVPPNAKLVPEQAECVFEGRIYSVWQWQQEMFDGSKETFEMLKRYDTVEIISIIGDKIIIQEEEQPHIGKFTDIPGGKHDEDGEDELDCAKRELAEEAGYEFLNWKLIGVQQYGSKEERFYYTFLAYGDNKKVPTKHDPGEKITCRLVDFDEFKKLAPSLRSHRGIRDILDKCETLDDLLNLPSIG